MSEIGPEGVEIVVQRDYRWLAVSCVGAMLVALGTFLPYARFVPLSIGYVVNRTDWQLGADSTLTFAGAPLLLMYVAVVLLGEFALQGHSIRPMNLSRFRVTLFTQAMIGLLLIQVFLGTFPGGWKPMSDYSVQRGVGGYVSLFGIALLIGGILREELVFYFTHVRNNGFLHSPLTAYEKKLLDNFERRRWIRFGPSVVAGAAFALSAKWISSGTWLMALIDFLGFSAILGAWTIWSVRRIRNRRAELTEMAK